MGKTTITEPSDLEEGDDQTRLELDTGVTAPSHTKPLTLLGDAKGIKITPKVKF